MKNLKLFSCAFTMVELIFVIIVIGILSYVGSNFMPDNRLSNDTKFLLLKIRQKQKNAIGRNLIKFGENPWESNDSAICIDVNVTKLEAEDLSTQKPYKFSSKFSMDGDNSRICFDKYGRPYQSRTLLQVVKDINITKDSKIRRVKLFPMSGYVTIVR